ncbi:Tad domain-containing protein [Cytobacillus suaedae]|nr:Tad domain-containing protein [Cytobacillus suaedae]
MKKNLKKFLQKEEGNVLLLVSLAFMGLLTMGGLVMDGGTMYMTKSHLQKVANAAVLSGAQELTNTEIAVRDVVNEVLLAHGEEGHLQGITITMGERVEIELKQTVPLVFSKLLGFATVDVHSNAAAELRVMGRAIGAAPLGIDDSINLDYYTQYKLKVDSTGVEYGNFGVLALGGSGAATYEDNLRNGYQQEVRVGDILNTETGNIAGKTRSVIKERVDGCLHMAESMYERDCSRIILIPTYKPYGDYVNQMQQIQITGFAYFYILDPMDSKDTSITGMFIKRAGTGFEEPNSLNKGAFSIRLTE